MRARNPLITAVVLSLAMTGPTLAAVLDGGSDGIYDQDQSKKKPNRGQGNNGGNQGGEDLTRMRFYGMDTNRDGRITRNEWRGNQNSFNQHDWNGDGVLSGIEVTPGTQRPGSGDAGEQFNRLDLNRDGRISLSEWTGDRNTFDRIDRNDDGFLSRDELQNSHHGRGHHFDVLDRNGDGRLALSEWLGDRNTFNRLDRNRDGFLSRKEFAGFDDDED